MWWKFAICFLSQSKQLFRRRRRRRRACGSHCKRARTVMPRQLAQEKWPLKFSWCCCLRSWARRPLVSRAGESQWFKTAKNCHKLASLNGVISQVFPRKCCHTPTDKFDAQKLSNRTVNFTNFLDLVFGGFLIFGPSVWVQQWRFSAMSADQLIGVVSDDKAQTTTVEKLQWANFLVAHLLRHFWSFVFSFFLSFFW